MTLSVFEEANVPKLQDFWHCLLWQTARGPPSQSTPCCHVRALPSLVAARAAGKVVGRATRLQMDRLQRIEKHNSEFKVC